MKNVALTGAAGYLGSKLLQLLKDHEAVEKVLCIDCNSLHPETVTEKTICHQADICDPGLEEKLIEHNIDTIIHLAFIVNPIRDLAKMHRVNLEGTKNIIAAAKSSGTTHFILASSTSAFGAFPDNPELLEETAPLRRHKGYTYAENKYDVEMFVKNELQNRSIKLAVVRPCIIYGPGVDNYLSRFLLDKPFLFQIGNARPQMQFVHEDDVASAFIRVFELEAQGTFHVVGNGLVSTTEIAALAGLKILSLPAWLIYPLVNLLYRLHIPGIEAPAQMLDFIRYRWTVTDRETRNKLDFTPQYSSKEVISILVKSNAEKANNNY